MKKIITSALLCAGSIGLFAQATCETAPTISEGIQNASFSVGSQVPYPCENTIDNDPNQGTWYKYMPLENYSVTVRTDVPGYPPSNTRVHIFTGNCSNLFCIEGDDNSGDGEAALVTFDAMAGQTYYIAFDNNWSGAPFAFSLTENEYVPPLFDAPVSVNLLGGYKLCIVDINGDYLDDMVSPENGSVHVLLQNEDGSFTQGVYSTPTTNYLPGWSMAAGDYNKDGYNDLLYGNGSGAVVMLSDGNGTGFNNMLQSTQYVFSQRTNFVDINNDGNLDAFVCHDVEPNVYFLNDGSEGFTFHQGGLGDYFSGGHYGSLWTDYDNDGDIDLHITKCGGTERAVDEIHRNNGDGTFTTITSYTSDSTNLGVGYHQGWSSAWGDFDNDGDMDVMVGASSFGNGHRLMQNNGDGTFTDVSLGSGFDAFTSTSIEHVAHDFDNDGYVDVMSGGHIMINNGDMTFTQMANSPGSGPIGDLNNDGFLDVQNFNSVYYNHGNDNNWIKVLLQGVESNRNGIGARVEIIGEWGKQIRDVKSGDGFEFMSSLNTHFGIGEYDEIEQLVIKWPSGTIDIIENPDINSSILVEEGSTLMSTDNPLSAKFILTPNPATDFINVNGDAEVVRAVIYDLNGRMVSNISVSGNTIPVQTLAKGTYIVIVQGSNGKYHSSKFIKE